MTADFAAGDQALGYLYQARYALWLLLYRGEESELVIENLDDIVFEEQGNPKELLQLKHHSHPAALTNASPELWKTLRIWSDHVANGKIKPNNTILTLITTASAADTSVAAKLRSDINRNPSSALLDLIDIAQTSNNASLQNAFTAFLNISGEEREQLVESIHILDHSADILNTADLIKEKIKLAVSREHRDGLYERLEGWWFSKVVSHLSSSSVETITGFEVFDRIVFIANQFHPDALPIDFLDAKPKNINAESDNRLFVQQLRSVNVQNRRIEKAIVDYYRAFEQRSRWAREELLIGNELEQYEKTLIDEWERYMLAINDEHDYNKLSEPKLKEIGRQIYNWVEQVADFKIRPNVTEPYVIRGSYHMLADNKPPRVWWHPMFINRLTELITQGIVAE